ncbi:MAG TPA: alpha/beta fold hydrolase [Micrococcaceae bacterium]
MTLPAPGYLDLDGVRSRYVASGDPAAPPVLLLHGIGRSLEDMSGLAARLTPGYRVISVDLPGFGLSDGLAGGYSLEGLARGVLASLDAMAERRPVHVVGNSLGGAVAMQLSVLAPERVKSLTLIDSAGFGSEVTIALRLLSLGPIGAILLRRKTRDTAYRTERALFADRKFVTEERIRHALAVGANPAYDGAFLATTRFLGTIRGVRPGWRSRLLAIVAAQRKPTLIVWGDQDRILPANHAGNARELLPHARVHIYEKCGHMPQIEREEEFAALAREFITGVEQQWPGER